jgi:hypothetical protein
MPNVNQTFLTSSFIARPEICPGYVFGAYRIEKIESLPELHRAGLSVSADRALESEALVEATANGSRAAEIRRPTR